MQSLHRAAGLKNNGDEKGTQGEDQVKLSWEKTRAPGAETGERQRELAILVHARRPGTEYAPNNNKYADDVARTSLWNQLMFFLISRKPRETSK